MPLDSGGVNSPRPTPRPRPRPAPVPVRPAPLPLPSMPSMPSGGGVPLFFQNSSPAFQSAPTAPEALAPQLAMGAEWEDVPVEWILRRRLKEDRIFDPTGAIGGVGRVGQGGLGLISKLLGRGSGAERVKSYPTGRSVFRGVKGSLLGPGWMRRNMGSHANMGGRVDDYRHVMRQREVLDSLEKARGVEPTALRGMFNTSSDYAQAWRTLDDSKNMRKMVSPRYYNDDDIAGLFNRRIRQEPPLSRYENMDVPDAEVFFDPTDLGSQLNPAWMQHFDEAGIMLPAKSPEKSKALLDILRSGYKKTDLPYTSPLNARDAVRGSGRYRPVWRYGD